MSHDNEPGSLDPTLLRKARELQQEEVEALGAIYGEDFTLIAAGGGTKAEIQFEVRVRGGRFGVDGVRLSCVLPLAYPLGYSGGGCWPRCTLRGETAWLEPAVEASVLDCLHGLRGVVEEGTESGGSGGSCGDGGGSACCGEAVLFEWVEWLREHLEVPADVVDGSRWRTAAERLEEHCAAERAAMVEAAAVKEEEEKETKCGRRNAGAVTAPRPPRRAAVALTAVATTARAIVLKFDHIKSKSARKQIAALATEHALSGILRPGKPGLVFVAGATPAIGAFETQVRAALSKCTRNSGCWGPENHHFQQISLAAEEGDCATAAQLARSGDGAFVEVETETTMHLAGTCIERGLSSLFYAATGLNPEWRVPPDTGGPDPYLKPRGGTRRKCSNKRIF